GWSRWVCEAIVDDYGCEPALVLPVGAGGNAALAPPGGKSYARRIALFVGNKYELKGVPTLLEAWSLVRDELPDALLWIVGVDRPRHAGEHLHSVQWFGYVSDRQRLEELYVGALPELVEDRRTGVLVPPRDPERLAEALVSLLSDPDQAERLGRAGYVKARDQLTWRAVAERMAPHLDAAARG